MSTELLPFFIILVVFLVLGFATLRVVLSVVEKRSRTLWRVEAKLDLLLRHAQIDFDPYKNLPAEVIDAMRRGERIRAIKLYRDSSGAPLREARDLIDEALRRA